MKELTIEQKAKRYDEAIRESSKIINFCTGGANIPECVSVKATIEHIFPELTESGDEKIRKELLQWLKEKKAAPNIGFSDEKMTNWIAWVEKHGGQKTVDEIAKDVCKNRASATTFLKSAGFMNEKGELAEQYRQDEQKSYASKTMNEKGDFDNGFTRMMEKEQTPAWSEKDKEMSRFIGNAITTDDSSVYLKSKGIEVIDAHVWLDELKDRVQLQPKQEWSEEDSRILYNVKAYIGYAAGQRGVKDELFKEANEWLNSLPIGFICNKNYNEDMVTLLIGELEQIANDNNAPLQYQAEINWLKSLRPQPQWKPSDEQIEALESATENCAYSEYQDCLRELIGQLKKLKGE